MQILEAKIEISGRRAKLSRLSVRGQAENLRVEVIGERTTLFVVDGDDAGEDWEAAKDLVELVTGSCWKQHMTNSEVNDLMFFVRQVAGV